MTTDYHYITARLLELAARPQGVTTKECAAEVGGTDVPVRSAIWRCKKKGTIFCKAGLDARGVFVNRNFTTQAAADAFTFAKVRHATAAGRAKKTHDLILGTIDVPRTSMQIAEKIGRCVESATKSIQQMVNNGLIFKAPCRNPENKRVAYMMFTTESARDVWQLANPLQPIIRVDKRVRKPRIKKPTIRKSARSALSPVGRKDKLMAEILSRQSIKSFAVTAKPHEYVLTKEDKKKIQHCESYAGFGNRAYVAPDKVPMTFAAMRPGQYLEQKA